MNKEYLNIDHNRKELSDSEALEASIRTPALFSVIVERYEREFLRKALRIVGNKDEALDIVQDVFVKIYKNAHRFTHKEGATFKSWGYKILVNTCFSHCKRKKREKQFFAYADEDMLDTYSEGMGYFDTILDTNQVMVAIKKIPAMLGRMVTLSLQGKTHEEIAVLERVPVGTIRTRLHRAKKEIQKFMT